MVILLAAELLAVPGGGAPARAVGDDAIGWSSDMRLSNNTTEDAQPVLQVDSFGNSHIFWRRGNDRTMYSLLDADGCALVSDSLLYSSLVPGTGADWVSRDGRGNFHIIWTPLFDSGVIYQKLDGAGYALSDPLNLAPDIQTATFMGLAANRDGIAYALFKNGDQDRIELACVDMSDPDGYVHTHIPVSGNAYGSMLALDRDGCPVVIYQSKSGGGLYFSRYASDGELVAGDIPVSGLSYPTWGMPRVAVGTDSSLHLLQQGFGLDDSTTLYYVRVDCYGSPLVYGMPVTNRTSDRGDICLDGQGNAHIVFINRTDGELYHVEVRNGHESEPLAPVRLTNASGEKRDPRIAVGPGGQLQVAWVDERDGNPKIYFKLGFRPGVELTISQDERGNLASFHLKEVRSGYLTARNMAFEAENCTLEVAADFGGLKGGTGKDYNGTGWKVWLDKTNLSLGPREAAPVALFVRGPSAGEMSDRISVSVRLASCSTPSRNSTVELEALLIIVYGLDLICPDNSSTTAPGVPASYSIRAAARDNYMTLLFFVDGVLEGWNYTLDPVGASLGPREEAELTLTVQPPPDSLWGAGCEVRVMAVAGDTTIEGLIKTTTTTALVTGLALEADRTSDIVDPGESVDYIIYIQSNCNSNRQLKVSLSADCSLEGWPVSLDLPMLNLVAYQRTSVVLGVTAPGNAFPGPSQEVTVVARDEEFNLTARCTTVTSVREVRDIRLGISNGTGAVLPGGQAVFCVTLSNAGNRPEELVPDGLELPAGWSGFLEFANGTRLDEAPVLAVRPGEKLPLALVIVTSPEALAGDYQFVVRFGGSDGAACAASGTVRVEQGPGCELLAAEEVRAGMSGGSVSYRLSLRNAGNARDIFRLEASGLPAGWPSPFIKDASGGTAGAVALEPSGELDFFVELAIPAGSWAGLSRFCITAASTGGAAAFVLLTVDVRQGELGILKVERWPRAPAAGALVKFNVTISNPGPCATGRIPVQMWKDGKWLGTKIVETIVAGSVRTVSFTWQAAAGRHRFRFVVDPDDTVRDTDRKNNSASNELEIGGGGGAPSDLWVPVAAGILGLVAALGILLAVRRRRRRPESKRTFQ